MKRRKFLKGSAMTSAALFMGLTSRAARSGTDRSNFLWIVAEDISPFFGCYGDPDAATPNIDAYVERSHVFKNAYVTAPICAPSRSCLATGMFATSLGTQNLRSEVELPDRIQPMAEVFQQHGYWTALRGKTDYNFSPDGLIDFWDQTTTPWRHCPADKPFFAFMNLGSTHEGSGNLTERAAPALKRLPKEFKHDPSSINLPPYFPDTPEMRRIWARYYDLITVWDHDVNQVLQQLEADGRADDTIVFLLADHGMGLPRYKRWLYLTGLHVPLIVHVPKKFQHLLGDAGQASVRDELVSFVDLPPTVLQMAGIPIPDNFQGRPLFSGQRRDYIFGARDRADDMVELSRAVFDGRFMYIRHYLPHMVPMQEGVIMSDYRKESHKELYRVHKAGKDNEQSIKLWQPHPFEELYDIKNDPRELNNVADDPNLSGVKNKLADVLREWILDTRDSGFLTEPEMHRRANAAGATVYDILQDRAQYPLRDILEAADQASRPNSDWLDAGDDPIITFWAIQQRIIRNAKSKKAVAFCSQFLDHENPMVRTAAAESLARMGHTDKAVPVYGELLKEEEPNLLLYVARSLALSFEDVRPLETEVRDARQRMLAPPGSKRPWKDFNYSAFTTWALEWALIKSGLNTPDDFGLRD